MKNNLFLKISALMLVLLLCAPMLMACNDTTWQPQGGSPSHGHDCIGPPPLRFDGETIKFFASSSDARSIALGDEDDPTLAVNAAINKRNEQVEKELGVDIVLEKTAELIDTHDHLLPILASEVYVYDVVLLNQYYDTGLTLGDTIGSFYNLLDLPNGASYLDLDASYWDQNLLEGASYKGVSFFLTGDLSLSHAGSTYVSFVNADLWAKYADDIAKLEHSGGYSDVYDIVKNGYWTMDLWMELAKLCYEDDGDKVKDYEDQAGFMAYEEQLNNVMADALMAGSKVHFGGIDKSGNVTVEIYSDKNLAFYEKLYTLLCESDTVIMPWMGDASDDDGVFIMDVFAKGKVLMNVHGLGYAKTYLSDMEDEYLVLPLPMFDRNQFDKTSRSLGYATRTDDWLYGVAICTAIGEEKLPAVTATLDLMAYYSEKWVTPAHLETLLGKNYPANAEMLELIEEGIYTDFIFAWNSHLNYPVWQLRQHYSEKNKIDNNLRTWDRGTTGALNSKLLDQIEGFFYPIGYY